MESTRYDRGTVSSTVRGLYAGGTSFHTYQYVNISVESNFNASDFGDLTSGRTQLTQGTLSNNVRGVFLDWSYRDAGANDIIDFVTISSGGNATDFGDRNRRWYKILMECVLTRALFSGWKRL